MRTVLNNLRSLAGGCPEQLARNGLKLAASTRILQPQTSACCRLANTLALCRNIWRRIGAGNRVFMSVKRTETKQRETTMKKLMLIASVILLINGCASPISKQAKEDLARPINCGNAEADIRSLTAEKQHAGSQAAAGVKAILPISLVADVVSGTEGDQVKVATGEYQRMIDKKIADIKQQCGM